jgi:hypothetical protein
VISRLSEATARKAKTKSEQGSRFYDRQRAA